MFKQVLALETFLFFLFKHLVFEILVSRRNAIKRFIFFGPLIVFSRLKIEGGIFIADILREKQILSQCVIRYQLLMSKVSRYILGIVHKFHHNFRVAAKGIRLPK